MSCMTGPQSRSGYRERNSTADRALDILLLFDDTKLAVSAADVADRLSVARSTAYRYLQSLTRSGFLEESQAQLGFRLGPKVLELARLARKGIGLSDISKPVMRDLSSSVGETVLLTRRTGSWVVCLELEESEHPVRLSYERGHLLPANAGAAAQVLLAWESSDIIETVLESSSLQRFTASTLVDPATIRSRLDQIRMQGFAVSRGELDDSIVGIAAPIRNSAGRVVAAISIAGLDSRVGQDRVPGIVSSVSTAAAAISERLAQLTA